MLRHEMKVEICADIETLAFRTSATVFF